MKRVHPAASLGLASALLLSSPGAGAWAAVGKIARTVAAVDAAGAAGAPLTAASAVLARPSSAVSVPVLPSSVAVSAAHQRPAPGLPSARVSAPSVQAPSAARVPTPAAAPTPGLLPVLARLSVGASATDAGRLGVFYDRSARPAAASSGVPAVAASRSWRAALAAASKRRMPEPELDELGRPTPAGELDELGNPRRSGGEGGPDDASVADQGLPGSGTLLAALAVAGRHALRPAVAALERMAGSLRPARMPTLVAGASPAAAAPPAADDRATVERIVVFAGSGAVAQDLHLSAADPRAADYAVAFGKIQRALLGQMAAAGLSAEELASYEATPIASYRRINAATIRLSAAKAEAFDAAMAARGARVSPNDRRIVIPRPPVIPESADPAARNPVGMAENLRITRADAVHAEARKRWGRPDMGFWRRWLGAGPVQPRVAVIDSGADTSHPLLKRVAQVKNVTAGENVDDIGHGSWVTSMVLNYAPWLKSIVHYKAFVGGSATTDDILKALTAAANDGNLVISNSWGDDDGDPDGPDAKLVRTLAEEGHVLVFAAGNAGPGRNTIGSPAIVQYKDSATGAIRVVAVAATDRDKKAAFFSSRGPGSPKTRGRDDLAHRPDLAAIGYNTEGAWPASLGDADRTDPEAGPLKAISGTSMSTPSVAGAIALLLMMFGVTETGAKLDAVVNAVMSTLEKTGRNDRDAEGDGFLNVEAAYRALRRAGTKR